MALVVVRPTKTPNVYKVVGSSKVETARPGVVSTFQTDIDVESGDMFGNWCVGGDNGQFLAGPGQAWLVGGATSAPPNAGQTFTLTSVPDTRRLNISVLLTRDSGPSGRNPEPNDFGTTLPSAEFAADGTRNGSVGILANVAAVFWLADAFPAKAVVGLSSVNAPAPRFSAGGLTLGLTVTADGVAVKTFASPLRIHFPAGPGTPTYFDGTNSRAVTLIKGLPLPAGQTDGYVANPDGSYDVYTLHP